MGVVVAREVTAEATEPPAVGNVVFFGTVEWARDITGDNVLDTTTWVLTT